MKKKYDIDKDGIRNWLAPDQENTPSTEEVNQTEEALLSFARAHARPTSDRLRANILDKIARLNRQQEQARALDPNRLPFLEEHASWVDWEALVRDLSPPEDFENIHLHPLESNDQRDLFVIWVKEYVAEESHEDLLESFLILEGSCECHISNPAGETRVVRLGQGDFITMQLEEKHDIIITSAQPAKAILQWRKLAA